MIRSELRARIGSELERLSYELATRLSASAAESPEALGAGARVTLEKPLQRRIRCLGQLVAGLASVEAGMIWADRAGYGSTVRLRDRATGEEERHLLMAGDFIDLERGQLPLSSPLGAALLGRRAGDRVAVVTPGGERRYEILELRTLPARMGMAPPAAALPAPALQLA
jgi:transcription elongation factor GreA